MRGARSPLNVRSSERGTDALGERGHLLVELAPIGGEELEDQMFDAARGELFELVDHRCRLAGDHAAGVGGGGRTLARLKDADVVAQGERRDVHPTARCAESRELGAARAQLVRRAIDRMPRGAELRGATKRGPAMTADPDGRMRLL